MKSKSDAAKPRKISDGKDNAAALAELQRYGDKRKTQMFYLVLSTEWTENTPRIVGPFDSHDETYQFLISSVRNYIHSSNCEYNFDDTGYSDEALLDEYVDELDADSNWMIAHDIVAPTEKG